MTSSRSSIPSDPPRTLVVKVGSAVLAPAGELDDAAVLRLTGDLASVISLGWRVVLVTSGAVASGFRSLGLQSPPREIVLKQAAAAVGQQRLMRAYADAFARHAVTVAQVLLTGDDFDHRARHLNARGTLSALLERGVLPIINENDSVSFAEIKLGDNDRLSSLVAGLVQADLLLILSTAGGLYEGGDASRIIPVVHDLAAARRHVSAGTSAVGTGGMTTKLDAVETAAAAGVPTVVAGGEVPDVIRRIIEGESIGTRFDVTLKAAGARKRWIGFASRPKGAVIVDDGARRAIIDRGASLLPSGIAGVEGDFDAGSVVEIRTTGGDAFARGIVSYSAQEVDQIRGGRASRIAATLGYVYREEVIHRDDMFVLPRATPRPGAGRDQPGSKEQPR